VAWEEAFGQVVSSHRDSGLAGATVKPTAEISFIRCPTHGEMVAVNLWRELLGRCSQCMAEAAQALTILEKEAA
jgi:hypothetical protein